MDVKRPAKYEAMQRKLDKQFNGHVDLDMVINALIEYDSQNRENEELAAAMLITNESVRKYHRWKRLDAEGRLLELPCAAGDVIKIMTPEGFADAEVKGFSYSQVYGFCIVATSKEHGEQAIPFSEFGRTESTTKLDFIKGDDND